MSASQSESKVEQLEYKTIEDLLADLYPSYNNAVLKAICKKLKLTQGGKREVILARINEYLREHPEKMCADLLPERPADSISEPEPAQQAAAVTVVQNIADLTPAILESDKSGNSIISCVNACHNILRNNDSIVGEKAMHDIMRLLFLKFLEPLIDSGVIEIKDPSDTMHKGMSKYAKFSVFCESSGTATDVLSKQIWKLVLAKTDTISDIFHKDDYWNCSQETLLLLINKIDDALKGDKFDELDTKSKCHIYGEFLSGYSNNAGKEFGRYFTAQNYISLILSQILPEQITYFKKLIGENKFSVLDPCMGVANFITETYKFMNIKDTTNILHGCEIESETYIYSLINIILNTGSLEMSNFIRGDSLFILDPRMKYDFIPTTPYGMSTDYITIKSKYNNKWVTELANPVLNFPKWETIFPITTNDSLSLFMMLIAFKLNKGGIATPRIMNGKIINGKNFGKLRKYLMDPDGGGIVIDKIMYTDGGLFKHAAVKTAVIWMRKPLIITPDTFKQGVKFVETTKQLGDLTDIKTITHEQLANNNWSWDVSSYREYKIPSYNLCEWKQLDEICLPILGISRKYKDGYKTGLYPLYYSSISNPLYLDSYDYSDDGVILSKTSNSDKAIIYYGENKYNVGEKMIHFRTSSSNIKTKYVYYYLIYNIKLIEEMFLESPHGSISEDDLFKIKIPAPSIMIQENIIAQLDALEKSKTIYRAEIESRKTTIELYEKHMKPPFERYSTQIEHKLLGEICESINGAALKKSEIIEGPYPVIGGGRTPFGHHARFNSEEHTILCASSGSAGYLSKYSTPVWKSDCFSIEPVDENNKPYIWLYLKSIQHQIYKLRSGACHQHVYWSDLKNLKIPVPTLDIQKEFVQFYEEKESTIKKIEAFIAGSENYINTLDELGRSIIKDIIISS